MLLVCGLDDLITVLARHVAVLALILQGLVADSFVAVRVSAMIVFETTVIGSMAFNKVTAHLLIASPGLVGAPDNQAIELSADQPSSTKAV
jgi:hypothetical protein